MDSIATLPDETSLIRFIDSIPNGVVGFDVTGRIFLANAEVETLFGYERGELLGRPIETLLPERYREAHVRMRTQCSRDLSRTGRDVFGLCKDGREIPIEIGLNPIESESGLIVLAAVTDISARKQMESELRQANADLEEFAYVVSHDLKSPLRAVADMVEWLTGEIDEGASGRILRDLGRIESRVAGMERLIDDLLAYARASEAPAEAVSVNLREMIQSVGDFLHRPNEVKLAVRCEIDEIVTYRTPLETVLRNLIGNAIAHHDRAERTIEISVTAEDGYCCFTVSDDGPGIPESKRQYVFELFRTFAAAGNGIGLAVCKRLVEKHGGRIVLEDNAQGRGATLRFWWPRLLRRDAARETGRVVTQSVSGVPTT